MKPFAPIRKEQVLALVRQHLRVLALAAPGPLVLGLRAGLTLLALHLAGLLVVARLAHWPWWAAPALLLAFSLPPLLRRPWRPEALVPLGALYALAAARVLWVFALRQPAPAALDYAWGLAVSAAWAALVALRGAGRLWLAPLLAGAAALALFAWQLWRLAPAGVTGADPLAYVQMALDLAEHGSPRHHFPLAPVAASLGLATLPVTHVGYVLPDAAGWAPTVWPAGHSALLAAAYRLGGERLLLGFNALVGLVSLALAGVLAARLARAWPRGAALAVAGAAVFLLATMPEQWVRLAVPLADGAAQALTTAAVLVGYVALDFRTGAERQPDAIPGPRRVAWPRPPAARVPAHSLLKTDGGLALLGALLGLALAAAFVVRYTQALVAPGLLLAALWALPRWRPRALFAAAMAGAGLLAAAPDLLYRTRLYGAPWRFGTGELALFSPLAVAGAVRQLAAELLGPAELGAPWALGLGALAVAGAAWLGRREPRALAVLVAAYAPVMVFHLFYPFVRLRDVLFALAPLAVLAALGLAALSAWLWRRGTAARLALIAGVLVLGAARVSPLLARAPGFYTAGALLPEQRQALASLAALTEPEAVIACSLNSGAVGLYAGRQTVRPGRVLQPHAAWSDADWLVFVAALLDDGRALYVLMDSPEMQAPLAALQTRYALEHVADLYVPVFVHTGGSENEIAQLWRVGLPAED